MQKDGRADIRINKEVKEALKKLNTTPQKIVDSWVKRNLRKILEVLKNKEQ